MAKLDDAKEAIDEVFSDTSCSQEETIEQLEELEADIRGKIRAIREDINRR